MSIKNSTTTADYIDFDKVTGTAAKLLKESKTLILGRYIIIAINTGLRSGNILQLSFKDLLGDTLTITEQKLVRRK